MKLGELKPSEGAKKARKRVGRGESSGLGKTSGRGHKGQRARSGKGLKPWFEGGQMPIVRRVPKKGFQPPKRTFYQVINVRDLNRFENGQEITRETLERNNLVSGKLPIKLLGDGELRVALTIQVDKASKTAIEKVEKNGGKVQVM